MSWPHIAAVFDNDLKKVEAFSSEPLVDRLGHSPFAQNHKIFHVLSQNIDQYEKSGKNRVTCLRTISKVITLSFVLFILFTAIAPMYLQSYAWLPWAGIGGYFVLGFIQTVLESQALAKEKRYESMLYLKEMLHSHSFQPLTAADLTAVDERLRSDQPLRKTLTDTHPHHAEHIVHVVKDYDLDADIVGMATSAAQLAQSFDPTSDAHWNAVRKRVKRAKHKLYQDHPGKVCQWFKNHLPCLTPATPAERVDRYRHAIEKARVVRQDLKTEAFGNEGAYSQVVGATGKRKSIPSESPLDSLKRSLMHFKRVEKEIDSLEQIYQSGRDSYQKTFPHLPEGTFAHEKYEDLYKGKLWMGTAVDFINNALQEGKTVSRAASLKPFRIALLYKMISKEVHALVTIMSALQRPLSEQAKLSLTQDLILQIEKLHKITTQFPDELPSLGNWINACPFFNKETTGNTEDMVNAFLQWMMTDQTYRQDLQVIDQEFVKYFGSDSPDDKQKDLRALANDLFLEVFPLTVEQETAWILQLAGKVEAWAQHFSVGHRELRPEIENWSVELPAIRLGKLQKRLENMKSSGRYGAYATEYQSLEITVKALEEGLAKCADADAYSTWITTCEALEKKSAELSIKMGTPSFVETALAVTKKFRETSPIVTNIEADNSLAHPQWHQRKIEELNLNKLLSKVDLSIARTNRFKGVVVEHVAVSILLLVDFFVFSYAWAGFGITLGLVGIFGAGRLVDRRLHKLQRRKQTLRMVRQLRNPVPQENAFNFEQQWRRVRAGDLEIASLPGNRPQLARLKDVAGRYGLDGTARSQGKGLIYPDSGVRVQKKKKPPVEPQKVTLYEESLTRVKEKKKAFDAQTKALTEKWQAHTEKTPRLLAAARPLLWAHVQAAGKQKETLAQVLKDERTAATTIEMRLNRLEACLKLSTAAMEGKEEKDQKLIKPLQVHWRQEQAMLRRLTAIGAVAADYVNKAKRLVPSTANNNNEIILQEMEELLDFQQLKSEVAQLRTRNQRLEQQRIAKRLQQLAERKTAYDAQRETLFTTWSTRHKETRSLTAAATPALTSALNIWKMRLGEEGIGTHAKRDALLREYKSTVENLPSDLSNKTALSSSEIQERLSTLNQFLILSEQALILLKEHSLCTQKEKQALECLHTQCEQEKESLHRLHAAALFESRYAVEKKALEAEVHENQPASEGAEEFATTILNQIRHTRAHRSIFRDKENTNVLALDALQNEYVSRVKGMREIKREQEETLKKRQHSQNRLEKEEAQWGVLFECLKSDPLFESAKTKVEEAVNRFRAIKAELCTYPKSPFPTESDLGERIKKFSSEMESLLKSEEKIIVESMTVEQKEQPLKPYRALVSLGNALNADCQCLSEQLEVLRKLKLTLDLLKLTYNKMVEQMRPFNKEKILQPTTVSTSPKDYDVLQKELVKETPALSTQEIRDKFKLLDSFNQTKLYWLLPPGVRNSIKTV